MNIIPETCPKCHANLQGAPIPQEYRNAGMYGDKTHYARVIAITDPKLDRITLWQCPDCHHQWPRQN